MIGAGDKLIVHDSFERSYLTLFDFYRDAFTYSILFISDIVTDPP